MPFSVNRPEHPTATQDAIEQRAKQIDAMLVQMLASMDDQTARGFAEEYIAVMIGRDRQQHVEWLEKALRDAAVLRNERST